MDSWFLNRSVCGYFLHSPGNPRIWASLTPGHLGEVLAQGFYKDFPFEEMCPASKIKPFPAPWGPPVTGSSPQRLALYFCDLLHFRLQAQERLVGSVLQAAIATPSRG